MSNKLETDGADVWLASTHLDADKWGKVKAWLGASELARFSKIQSTSKQLEYLASRCLMRQALSARFAKPLAYWQISERPAAAPRVDNAIAACFISLSHSAGKVVVALDSQPLGVDIEQHRAVPRQMKIASRLFTQEQCARLEVSRAQVNADEESEAELFFEFWTAKEAQYKALSQAGNSPQFFGRASLGGGENVTQHFRQEDFTIAITSQPAIKPWRLRQVLL